MAPRFVNRQPHSPRDELSAGMREWVTRLLAVGRRGRRDRELDEELEFHVENLAAAYERRGLDRQAAREAAERELGGIVHTKQAWRDQRTWLPLEELLQDVRYGVRVLRRTPSVSLLAGLTLALAVAATTSVFSVVDAVLLAPLPYGRSEQLVVINENFLTQHAANVSVTPGNFLEWRDRARTLAALTAIDRRQQNLTRDGEPQQVSVAAVTEDFGATVEVQPILGRMFQPSEFQSGRDNVVLIAHSLWTARYGRANVVGRAITIDDHPYTIVGVMPAGFMFPAPGTEIWTPLPMTVADRENRTGHTLACVGRLKNGVSVASGRRDLDNVAETLAREYPESNAEWRVTVLGAREALVGKTGLVLAAMTGASGLLLLVACANVASLLLTHGLSRSREIAIRAAVGADRRRVVRQLVTESLLLALLAGGLGIALAWATQPVLALLRPADFITWKAIGIDGRSLAFALGAATLSGILFGTLPALIASRSNIGSLASIRSAGTGASRLRQTLVAFEVSLALVLVIGAALLGQTLARLTDVDLGFVPDQVVTMQLSLPETRYADDRRVNAFYDQVLERIRALPGVRAVGAIHALPLSGNTSVRPYRIDGGPEGNARPVAHYRIVTPGYFEALRLPLRAGRTFDARDVPGHPLAVVVSDTFRRQAWGDRNPVGARITFGGSNDVWAEVVGVVGDVRHFGPGTPVAAEMYWPSAQIDALPSPTLHLMRRRLTLVVSADRDPVPFVPAIRSVVASVDPDQPIATVRTMTSLVGASLWLSRASTWMLTVFGGAALAFALLGVFGAASYAVAQRRRELAVRIALGAEPGAVMRLVMRGALSAVLAGIVVGLLLAGVLGKTIESLLVDLTPTDARTLVAMSAAIALATLGACWVPARRAARIEPMRALRTE